MHSKEVKVIKIGELNLNYKVRLNIILILFAILSLTILSSCKNNPVNEVNIKDEENINKNESGVTIRMGPKLNNLKDIEEDMIIDNYIGNFFLTIVLHLKLMVHH